MSDLSEALALWDARTVPLPNDSVLPTILAAARNWHTLTNPNDKGLMRIFGTAEGMKAARKQLGSPAALNEAIVATGIDALFWLLDGGSIAIEGRHLTLVDALTDTAEPPMEDDDA